MSQHRADPAERTPWWRRLRVGGKHRKTRAVLRAERDWVMFEAWLDRDQ